MNGLITFNQNFYNNLIKNKLLNHNPFSMNINAQKKEEFILFSPFWFVEDLFEKEVRYPICLGRIKKACTPKDCLHTFCYFLFKTMEKFVRKMSYM